MLAHLFLQLFLHCRFPCKTTASKHYRVHRACCDHCLEQLWSEEDVLLGGVSKQNLTVPQTFNKIAAGQQHVFLCTHLPCTVHFLTRFMRPKTPTRRSTLVHSQICPQPHLPCTVASYAACNILATLAQHFLLHRSTQRESEKGVF